MDMNESKRNTPLRRHSRVTRFAYVIIFLLAGLYIFSSLLIFTLTLMAEKGSVSSNISDLVSRVCDFISIDVAGAIGTIATAVIARYGVREFSANWKGIKYNSETEKDENNSSGIKA